MYICSYLYIPLVIHGNNAIVQRGDSLGKVNYWTKSLGNCRSWRATLKQSVRVKERTAESPYTSWYRLRGSPKGLEVREPYKDISDRVGCKGQSS